MKKNIHKLPSWVYVLIILLIIPALFINLGLMTFIEDEAIRVLVAIEMRLSGNFITPMLNGGYYYNKPPLYNWLLAAFFYVTGAVNEWTARIPTLFFLLAYGATVFHFFKKHYSFKIAFLNALLLITCGRILFWDSILAFIDICFSWVTFLTFMVIYHQFQKKNIWTLFIISYLLTAIAFLMKGMPSLVFQGITLLVFFLYKKEWKKLFSPAHAVGILLFLVIVGSYYWAYNGYNSLTGVFPTLLSESTKRTVVQYDFWEVILHLIEFPFEMSYHFLPWSLLIIYWFGKNGVRNLLADPFIKFNMIVFVANILIYWTSPEVYPRYLLMLAPLIFSSFIHLHFLNQQKNSLLYRIINGIFFAFFVILTIGSFSPFFLEQTAQTPFLYLKAIPITLSMMMLTFIAWKWKEHRLIMMVVCLLLMRIGFNWFVLPDRNKNDWGNLCREDAIEMGKQMKGKKLYVYKNTTMYLLNSLHMTVGRNEIIPRRHQDFEKDAYYILDPTKYPYTENSFRKVAEFRIRAEPKVLDVVQIED